MDTGDAIDGKQYWNEFIFQGKPAKGLHREVRERNSNSAINFYSRYVVTSADQVSFWQSYL